MAQNNDSFNDDGKQELSHLSERLDEKDSDRQNRVTLCPVSERFIGPFREVPIRPRLQEVAASGFALELTTLVGALERCEQATANLDNLLGDKAYWTEFLDEAPDLSKVIPVEFELDIRDLGTTAAASMTSPDGDMQLLIVLARHRLMAITPDIIRAELPFLNSQVHDGIWRKLSGLRRSGMPMTMVFFTWHFDESVVSGRDFALMQRILIAAMVPWLTRRDAIANFNRSPVVE
jgi:hypothetical protein